MPTRRAKRSDRFQAMNRHARVYHPIPELNELAALATYPEDSAELGRWMRTRRFVSGFTSYARVRIEQRCGISAEDSFSVAYDVARQVNEGRAVLLATTFEPGRYIAAVGIRGRAWAVVICTDRYPRVVSVLPEVVFKEYALTTLQTIEVDDLRERSEKCAVAS